MPWLLMTPWDLIYPPWQPVSQLHCNQRPKTGSVFGESLLLRKLILGVQAQVRGKSLTGLIKICDALIRPASTYKNPRGVFI
ncbi:hypothetical protein BPLS_P4737 [Bathymodiolus platifrons methanotrophic gill symbiont]|nr:hypothetical protein BMR05_03885 [Methylococcaceae bacterium HT4]GFO76754.1 hypothetical protein BPLS_P4737 [Bathymodiolus platifrons methanotrophic gill symbiont]